MNLSETRNQEFDRDTRLLLESLGTRLSSTLNDNMRVVFDTTQRMCTQLRSDNPEPLENWVSELLNSLGPEHKEPERWLSDAYRVILSDIDGTRGWAAYLTLVITMELMVEVAQRFADQGGTINSSKLQGMLINRAHEYIEANLKPIILELGGWSDIIDYNRHINKNKESKLGATGRRWYNFKILAILGVCCAIFWRL